MIPKSRMLLVTAILAVISLTGWLAAREMADVSGFPLDDAWIHQTYARSLAGGGGWSFSPGEASAGATAPLWVLLLVPGYWLGVAPFAWITLLALLQLWLVAVLGWALWMLLDAGEKKWGFAAAGLLVFEWHLMWAAVSGMETLLYGVLALAVTVILVLFSNYRTDKFWAWLGLGALIGLGVFLRPEAVTLLGPVGFTALLFPRNEFTGRIKLMLAALIGFFGLFAAYLVFNHWLAGSWWPNTFYAKQAEYAVLQEIPFLTRLGSQISPLLAGVLAVLLPGYVVNVYVSIKQQRWAALAGGVWAMGHVVLYAWRLPVIYQHGRYVIPALPILVVLGFIGYAQLLSVMRLPRIRWLFSRAMGGILVLVLMLFWYLGLQAYVDDIAFIDGEMVRTAAWINENTAEEDLIAAHDIGALGYFAQRPILDLAGLVSPDVIPFIRDETSLAEFLNQKCPAYLVTFPDWYLKLPAMGELVYQTDSQITLDLGYTNMAVYRWTGSCTFP